MRMGTFPRFCISIFALSALHQVQGHGRMMEPPNRSSIWRRPEYEGTNPPINYNDNELFCGGFVVQWEHNNGNCGPCGDPFNATTPRDNEHGGLYGQGIITKTYTKGQDFTILIDLTYGHLGYFEFRICSLDEGGQEVEDCFNQNLLTLRNGIPTTPTRYPVPGTGAQWYRVEATLPETLTCDHCVLQWHYYAGNSWGECDDGSWAVGCGPQETFRGCSDIAITN